MHHGQVESGGDGAVVMGEFEYEALLDRARENIPEDISNRRRWRLPEPQILIEGSNTIFQNFNAVVSMMERDENHVYQFIQNELGTSAARDGPRIRLKGRIPPKRIRKTIVNYVNTYIKCSQCSAPDTVFMKEDRTTLLKCQACGATRPVKL
jgi:translation initiation factor 2 subunit 2